MLSRQSLKGGSSVQSSQYIYGNVDCKIPLCINHEWWQHGAIKDEEISLRAVVKESRIPDWGKVLFSQRIQEE